MINMTLYFHGLQFSYDWYTEYSLLYMVQYQLLILFLTLWTKNFRLTLFWEVFVLSSSQDLVFFGLWNIGRFPVENWHWTFYYRILGFWTTETQFALTGLSIIATIICIRISQKINFNFISESSA